MADTRPGYDAFLSYGREDDPAFRTVLVDGLKAAGLRIWFDRDSMPNRGVTFDQEIRRAIQSSERLLLLLGPDALASGYVAQEWGFADDLGTPVLPVLREGSFSDLPERLRHYHAVDARPARTADSVVAEVVRLLSDPVQPLGRCHGVPHAAPHELERPDLLEGLSAALGLGGQRPQEAGRAGRAAVLSGTSGSGKSTVAAAFARGVRTRHTFPRGIVWLTCGPTFHALTAARRVLGQLAVGARVPGSPDEVADALAEGIQEQEVLLVLDDVRDPDSVRPFVGALGPGGRAVITALDGAIATALGAAHLPVGALDEDAARRLLESWAGGMLPPEAGDVLSAVDGLPFALAIVGAMVRNLVPWTAVAQALAGRRLDLIAARGYAYPSLLRALAASYDALAADDPAAARCYLELAAFPRGAALTAAVMTRLWSRPGGLAPLEASLVLPALERRLLVHRRVGPEGERFVLHSLHEDFVRLTCPNARDVEAALVETYRTEKGGAAWSTLDDDGYVYDHLVTHLVSLGARQELAGAVDAGWVHRQLLRRGDLGQALDDVEQALTDAARPPLDIVTIAGLSLLSGQVAVSLREAPTRLVGAMAEAGDVEQALRWAGDKPDAAKRFHALTFIVDTLTRSGDIALARMALRTAVATIPLIAGVVETGLFPALTQLNAVHALVEFPDPDAWEGTTSELVDIARIPVDALVRLAPLADRIGIIAELTAVSHPFWDLYGHLIPLVAVEHLAAVGAPEAAAALLDELAVPARQTGEDPFPDLVHAARYRHAVAAAAVGRFEDAQAAVAMLPEQYLPVGRGGLARHLAAAGRVDEALALVALIGDATVADQTTQRIVKKAIERAGPAECRTLAGFVFDRGWDIAGAWLLAAAGDPGIGLELLDLSPDDETLLNVGVGLASTLLAREPVDQAVAVIRRLVPAANRLMGQQWFAPETIDVRPELSAFGHDLLSLLARSGEPIPEEATPVALIVESARHHVASFKLGLMADLATAGRLDEAMKLAERSALLYGPALCLATAILSADPGSGRALRPLALELADAVDGLVPQADLDTALVSATAALMRAGLRDEAARLVERLPPGHASWEAAAAWVYARASSGDAASVRELVRRLLTNRPLATPGASARASLLVAIAARRAEAAAVELRAAAELLGDLRVAAGTLNLVFELPAIMVLHSGLEGAEAVARSVADGPAAQLAEELLTGSIRWDDGTTEQDIATAAVVRSVAAASLVIATSRAGLEDEAQAWLERSEALRVRASAIAPNVGQNAALARYIAAARAELGAEPDTDEPGDPLRTAVILWDAGRSERAVEFATRALTALEEEPFPAGRQRIMSAEDFQRWLDLLSATRAGLAALIAHDAAGRGDEPRLHEALRTVEAALASRPHWLSLTLSEQTEVHAMLATALHRAGRDAMAAAQLARAAEHAVTLAQRGEVWPFGRLCQAVFELLPLERATMTWAQWLVAAAGSGADAAVLLIAACVRWLPDEVLSTVAVDPQTGRLVRNDG